jgi:hypothetical protein
MSQVDVGFEVTPFSSKESHPAPKAYTLTLEFEHGDERLSGAHITPADVDVSDLVTSFISVSSLWAAQHGVAASHPCVGCFVPLRASHLSVSPLLMVMASWIKVRY